MHRRPLLELLDLYAGRCPDEQDEVERVRALVRSHTDCFERDCLPGHITASSWIVSQDGLRCLLTHHRKLGRWLQLGGHADGDPDPEAVALREAQEESGMNDFVLVVPEDGCPVVDVDVHVIPAWRADPAHEHHDVRFVFRAGAGQPLSISQESTELAWFEWAGLDAVGADQSLLRLARKARALLEAKSIL
jgi:8-oxo-dGTP pyrophosphatase MutT (NUDIX family)